MKRLDRRRKLHPDDLKPQLEQHVRKRHDRFRARQPLGAPRKRHSRRVRSNKSLARRSKAVGSNSRPVRKKLPPPQSERYRGLPIMRQCIRWLGRLLRFKRGLSISRTKNRSSVSGSSSVPSQRLPLGPRRLRALHRGSSHLGTRRKNSLNPSHADYASSREGTGFSLMAPRL
jgi:hypothetical protein